MVKGGLPEKVTYEHRLRERRSEPANKTKQNETNKKTVLGEGHLGCSVG